MKGQLAVQPAQSIRTRPDWVRAWLSRETLTAYIFILPSLIGFAIFYAWPALRGLQISLTDWNLLQEPNWVGFDNYSKLLGDSQFWQSMLTTLAYVLLNIPIQTIIALGLAVLMTRLTESLVVRGLLVLPWLIPGVVVALLWLWLLDPSLGLLNQILGVFGIPRQGFLGSVAQALPAIAGINIWRFAGYTALLLFAGLQTVPKSLYEAASLDGASEFRMFWTITIPILRPVLVFVLVTSIIGSFQIFDTIAITTKGGPVSATRVIYWYIYDYAFNRFQMGFATAAAVVLFIFLIIITILQMRILRSNESDLD